MTLELVGDGFVPNDRHSVKVEPAALGDDLALVQAFGAAAVAAREFADAIAAGDRDGLIAACRRLSSAGELARLSAQRLEGSL